MDNSWSILLAVPTIFIVVSMWHYKFLRRALFIWIDEFLEYGEVWTKEADLDAMGGPGPFDMFKFMKTEKKHPKIKESEFLMQKLREYRLTRNFMYFGMIILGVIVWLSDLLST